MRFDQELVPATLVRRYKRFLADVALNDGSELTVHCPNSGSMESCLGEGWPVLVSDSRNPRRKLRYTWEMVHNGRCWIGINTHRANGLAAEAIASGVISELAGYTGLKREVRYGANSRIDILLDNASTRCFVEVKNVTLITEGGQYAFPDAVTVRGQKHLEELRRVVEGGHRGVILFVVQRSDGETFVPADHIDPTYGSLLRTAVANGVEAVAYRADVQPAGLEIVDPIPVDLAHGDRDL